MTACKRGEIVLVGFLFADESGLKLRPALVISSHAYHQDRQEIIVAAVTGNLRRARFGDHILANFGIPLILYEPRASFIVWLILMIVISPFLQFLMTLFGAQLALLWRRSGAGG